MISTALGGVGLCPTQHKKSFESFKRKRRDSLRREKKKSFSLRRNSNVCWGGGGALRFDVTMYVCLFSGASELAAEDLTDIYSMSGTPYNRDKPLPDMGQSPAPVFLWVQSKPAFA